MLKAGLTLSENNCHTAKKNCRNITKNFFFKLRSLNITLQSIVVFYNLNSPFVINGDYEIAVFIK